MQNVEVKIKMIDGSEWYVPNHIFNTWNVPEDPKAIIGNYIRGSSGPLIKVSTEPDGKGTVTHVNANFILQIDVKYSN